MLSTHFSALITFSSLLLLSIPALLLLFPDLIHQVLPRNSLVRHDSFISPKFTASVQPPRQPKIAFLFLTNTDIYFAPLWERFFQNSTHLINIYVHHDPSAPLEKPPTGLFANRFVLAQPTQRASPSLIVATKRLLKAALGDDVENEYFALLSPTCIPIHSFNFLYRTLVSDRRKRSFIEILSGEPHLWERYVARGEDVMQPEVSFDQFRVGSQFFVLSRRHARLIVRDRRLWKKFSLHCLSTALYGCFPEEHYFPTLLNMQDPQGCSGYTLTHVNWAASTDGHPHTYTPAEITPELIQELRKMNNSTNSYLFARKFSKECLEPLMNITDDVIFQDN